MTDWQAVSRLTDEELDRPAELWQPRVGQRVRILAAPECALHGDLRDVDLQAMIGRTGRITRCVCTPVDNQGRPTTDPAPHDAVHPYCVVLDEPPRLSDQFPVEIYRGMFATGTHAAAAELEPLDE